MIDMRRLKKTILPPRANPTKPKPEHKPTWAYQDWSFEANKQILDTLVANQKRKRK